jgi:hypothetical protein
MYPSNELPAALLGKMLCGWPLAMPCTWEYLTLLASMCCLMGAAAGRRERQRQSQAEAAKAAL